MTVEEEIGRIEEEIRRTPYNKATQKHIGILKSKLARLREEQARRLRGKAGLGYGIRKSGDATVVIVGFPSVGKSSLLNRITSADSRVADFDFTTLNVIPGVMEYNSAKIQVLDVPGVIEGVSEGKGRGREVLSVVRIADLLILLADCRKPEQIGIIQRELQKAGFRLNQKPPDVSIQKRFGGGIDIATSQKFRNLDKATIRSILQELRVLNAEVVIREDITPDQLIDCVVHNRVYVPSLSVLNKTDLPPKGELAFLRKRYPDALFISAGKGKNIQALKERVWKGLGLMRIYLKRVGREPDMKEPIVMPKGSTVKDAAEKIHRQAFGSRLKYARIWGKTARFPGQRRGVETILQDRDIVEFHTS
jgi:small GTP-binding protein